MVEVNKTVYLGVEAYEITNKKVSLLVVTGVGPRIISYGFCKKESILYVKTKDFLTDGDGYKFYGGHRLWHSPEDIVRSYQPDNIPCQVEVLPLGIKVSNVEVENKIRKSMQIEMKENGRVRIIHTVENISNFNYNLASWAITQLKQGGMAVMPQDTRKTGLLPNRSITLWDYSDMGDPRVKYGKSHIVINQDPQIANAYKLGTYNREGFLYYFVDGDLFVKEFDVSEGEFPDFGCNSEIYVNGDFIELESLSPMVELQPKESVSHTEVWELIEKVQKPEIEKVTALGVKEFVHA